LASESRRYLTTVALRYIALGYPDCSLVFIVYHKESNSA